MLQDKKNTLLVVEDSIDLQDLMKELLESEGYDVYCANNGLEALKLLQKRSDKLDLIILDLMMPVMDGFQFRKEQLKDKDFSDIPVVILTADGNAEAKMVQMEVKDYINKVSNIDSMLEVIRRNIRKR